MTDQETLLRAVAAHPDEDTPRLVYADLLTNSGGRRTPPARGSSERRST